MTLNELLVREQIDPEQVIVLRHKPFEASLLARLPSLAEDRPEVFNAYQQCQGLQLEGSMLKLQNSGYLASFLAYGTAKAVFVGLYKIKSSRSLTERGFWSLKANQDLKKLGMQGFIATRSRPTARWFDLELQPFQSQWKGRLIIDWPGRARSWWRRAHRNDLTVQAILEDSSLRNVMHNWQDLRISWNELDVLPVSWKLVLSQWRGIYYIHDASDRMAYVGSAGGVDNLWGRWRNYAATGHGSNKLLRQRNPSNFTFSILQLVSQDMNQQELVNIEESWKRRLATKHPNGLN